jgi:hypothetical protein
MRTASGYQAPAVPYHTPIVTDFSTPNLILPSGTRNILPTEELRSVGMPDGMGKTELCFLASLLLCDKNFNAEVAEELRGRGVLGCLAA